jgi:thymidylate synthase (FAD)
MAVELIDFMGDESRIVAAAQVSTKGAQVKAKSNPGLVGWLMRQRHASPMEHCLLTFRIEAPIFVTREILRHRISSFNEESGRYRVLRGVFYAPAKGRKLTQTGKVGDYNFEAGSGLQAAIVGLATRLSPQLSWLAYRLMLTAGVSREVARLVLPVSIYSSLYYTANLRSLLNFVSLRVDWGKEAAVRSHPQAEIESVGRQMAEAVEQLYPTVWENFKATGYRPV